MMSNWIILAPTASTSAISAARRPKPQANTDGTISMSPALGSRIVHIDHICRLLFLACSSCAAANGQFASFMKLSTQAARLFWCCR